MPSPTIFYVTVHSFFSSVEEARRPELRHRPFVVVGRAYPHRIVDTNALARAAGVSLSHTTATRTGLPNTVRTIVGSPARYREFSQAFYDILHRFSDQIEPSSLHAAYVEMNGYGHRWISPEAAAMDIQQTIMRELEMRCSVGIAATKSAAASVAQSSRLPRVYAVRQGYEQETMAPLSISCLPGIGPRAAHVLAGLGIRTIGQLAVVPERIMLQSFGQRGRSLWLLANGHDPRPVVGVAGTRSFSRSVTLSVPSDDHGLVTETVESLLHDVVAKLDRAERNARTVAVSVRDSHGQYLSRQHTFRLPLHDHALLRTATLGFWEALRERTNAPVAHVAVTVCALSRRSHQVTTIAPDEAATSRWFSSKPLRQAVAGLAQLFGTSPTTASSTA